MQTVWVTCIIVKVPLTWRHLFGLYRDINCHQEDIFPGKQDNARPHSAHGTTEWFLDTLHHRRDVPRGVAPVGDVGVLTPTLFPVRRFNTRTFFFAVLLKRITVSLVQSSLAALCLRSLRLLLSSPLKNDTGFECDRLMIGCSALSPASLCVLD